MRNPNDLRPILIHIQFGDSSDESKFIHQITLQRKQRNNYTDCYNIGCENILNRFGLISKFIFYEHIFINKTGTQIAAGMQNYMLAQTIRGDSQLK